jgi:hypothetical protein
MGIFHFMGLGRSVGAVTAAVSYLAARYQRQNADDRRFFGQSGELAQRADSEGLAPGDIQALVLFTTPEVRNREVHCYPYTENQLGFTAGAARTEGAIPELLRRLMRPELGVLAGRRPSVAVFWCDIDLRRLDLNFARIVQVMRAAKPRGDLGKEVWVNLTGGGNLLNFALQLAGSLTGVPARQFYLQADNNMLARPHLGRDALGEGDGFWIDVPIVYLDLSAAHRELLHTLQTLGPLSEEQLLNILRGSSQGEAFGELDGPALRRRFLVPLHAQQLIVWEEDRLGIGPRWPQLRGYAEALAQADQQASQSLEQLAKQVDWLHVDSPWAVSR